MQQTNPRGFFLGKSIAPLPQCCDEATGLRTAGPWQVGRAVHRLVAASLCAALAISGIGCASLAPRPSVGHAGFLAVSTLDVVSTQRALAAGAQEINPLMGSNPTALKMTAVKMVGWSLLRTIENTVEQEIGRDLRWYEQVLFWAIPTGLTAWASAHNFGVASEFSRRD